MPDAVLPPNAFSSPSPSMVREVLYPTNMPGYELGPENEFLPFTTRSRLTPSSMWKAAFLEPLFFQDDTSNVKLETVRCPLHCTLMRALPSPVTTCGPAFVMTSVGIKVPSDTFASVYQPSPDMCAMSSPSILMSSGKKDVASVCPLTVAVQTLSPSSYEAFNFSAHSYSPRSTQSQTCPSPSGLTVSFTSPSTR